MNRALPFLTVLSVAATTFADDQLFQQPDILARLIESAQASGDPLTSSTSENAAYYLRRAEYIGSCDAPFGRVHAAAFFFIRSAPKGSSLPSRGHDFVVFFDTTLKPRTRWDLDAPLAGLAFDQTKLLLGRKTLFDFARLPADCTVIVDGKPQPVPRWK